MLRIRRGIGSWGMCLLSLSLAVSGCGPIAASQTPPPKTTASPTPTNSPPSAPSTTPISAPQALAAAAELHVWIEDYVQAYGGRVTAAGVEKDARGVLEAVQANPASFVETRAIKGTDRSFFVVDGVPLAIQSEGTWRAILARDIADAKGAQFAMPMSSFQVYNKDFVNVIRNANVLTITMDLDTRTVFETMTKEDWKNVLRNWESIEAQLDSGQVPSGIPYSWSKADAIVAFAAENHMALRAQHLVWNADVPDAIYNGGFTKAELLKLLEFTIGAKVLKYKGVIAEWDAVDELIISQFSTDKWGFWQQHVGLMDATRLSASTIRKLDPAATITITDDHEMEARFYNQQPDLSVRFLAYVKTLKSEGLIDRVDIENNLWIYDLPDQTSMEAFLRQIQAEGIGLAAPEITVCPTKSFPLWDGPRKVYEMPDDPNKAVAEGHRRVVQAYVDVGAYDIGLGDVGDATSGYNYLAPGTNAAIFDSQWQPKMAYYEIVKIMYERFLLGV